METENKKEELDFEVNEFATEEKKNRIGKKASATAMAAGAAVAGGATALGAEAAMSLADEPIIDPEQVSDAIADSTVEIVMPKAAPRPRVVEPEAAPSQEQIDNISEAASQVATDNAEEGGEVAELIDGEALVDIDEIVEPLDNIDDISGEDIAMILDENVELPETIEEMMPIVDDIDGLAQIDDLIDDNNDFSTIDDLDLV